MFKSLVNSLHIMSTVTDNRLLHSAIKTYSAYFKIIERDELTTGEAACDMRVTALLSADV